MTDQWFYRMFGHDFGPIDFEELKLLAQQGALSASDEVRASDSSKWVSAGSVNELNLEGESSGAVATAVLPAPSATPSTCADDWFYQFHGQEMGPIGFDELLSFAEQGQLTADDDVKLGATGKWRRVGSIGRLVAVLPYVAVSEPPVKESKKQPAPEPQKAEPPAAAAQRVAQPAPAAVDNSAAIAAGIAAANAAAAAVAAAHAELGQAQADYATADHNARAMIQWALAPHVDPTWWGWIGGVEYGPLNFLQVYELGVSGRIQTTDFLKNGMYGQYVPAGNLPGLFNAVAVMKQAGTALIAAKTKVSEATTMAAQIPPVPVQATVAPAPAPTSKAPSSAAVTIPADPVKSPVPAEASKPAAPAAKTEAVTTPAKTEEAPKPASSASVSVPAAAAMTAAPRPSSFSSPSSYSTPTPRPASPPPRPAPSRASSGKSMSEMFQDPKVLGVVGLLAAGLLVVGGMYLMPSFSKGPDIAKYRELKKFLDDVKAARAGSKNMGEFKGRADKMIAEYVPVLKNEASTQYPAKQNLLWAVRDELPRMMKDLSVESPSEKAFAGRLKTAAELLGISP